VTSHLTTEKTSGGSPINLSFGFQWLIANAAGFAIGMAIRQFMFGLGSWAINPFVIGAVIGSTIGIVQIFNLQHLYQPAWWWILSNTVGWTLSWGLIDQQIGFFVLGLGITQFSMVRGAMAGLLSGLIQWLILRQQYRRPGWWVPANAVGWSAGMAVGITVGGPFGWPLVGAVSGIISGLPLAWILKTEKE